MGSGGGVGRAGGVFGLGARTTGGRGCPGGTTDTELLRTCIGFLSFVLSGTIAGCFSVDPLFSDSSW